MTELLTAAQMRAIEQAAIASGEVTGLELMERAGRGVVKAIFEEWPELRATSHRAVVLCGPGNNGGDGFVVARLLKEWGWEVEVFLYGDPEKLPPDARVNYERWRELGECRPLAEAVGTIIDFRPRLVLDAVFGTGLTRAPDELLTRVFRDVHTCRCGSGIEAHIVSIDIPSGVCSDSGRTLHSSESHASPEQDNTVFELQNGVEADLTVTFHRRKIGHLLGNGAQCAGRVRIVSLGHPLDTGSKSKTWLHEAAGLAPRPLQMHRITVRSDEPLGLVDVGKCSGHKYTHGHAVILSGGPGKGGAARLAARGALRIGAGLVTVACPAEALAENAAQLNAIMLRPLAEISDLVETLSDDRITAVCLGPGLGLEEDARAEVTAVLGAERATVLDADALTAHADDPPSLFDQLHDRCVLTPHAGEFARLFPDIAKKLNAPATKGPAYSKVDATRAAAKRAGCVVLYKGSDTVIAAPDGRRSINSAQYDRAAPWLATAGSGDVLAGFVTGLLARGFDPMSAAETAAWLHVECGLKFGPGLIAEDLPEQLPAVFRDLGR